MRSYPTNVNYLNPPYFKSNWNDLPDPSNSPATLKIQQAIYTPALSNEPDNLLVVAEPIVYRSRH